MSNSDDTQPKRPERLDEKLAESTQDTIQPYSDHPGDDYDGIPAPPKFLMWGIIGLFLLGIIGSIAGVFVFRDVMTPGQQARVIDQVPFMQALLPPRPAAGDTLATAGPIDETAIEDLLSTSLNDNDLADDNGDPAEEAESTPEILPEIDDPTTDEAEDEEDVVADEGVAAAPTEVPSTPLPQPTIQPTTIPATAVPAPTEVIESREDTSVAVAQSAPSSNDMTWSSNAYNSGFRHVVQTWNNCGPANATMALSYYGWTRDQAYAANYLKPEREDKNVSPHEIVDFINEQTDVRALWRMGGDLDLLRILIDNQFPVIIERSAMFEGYDWIGHYQTMVGYDDSASSFYIFDSFLGVGPDGSGLRETYDEVDRAWRDFNRIFIVVYEPAREERLMSLLGDHANPLDAAEHAFAIAQTEARENPEDPFAFFNMGTALTKLGQYQQAQRAFDQATQLGTPWRMLWYQFGLYEAYYQVGRYQDVLDYTQANLNNGGEWVEETFYWRGKALAALGRTQEAQSAFSMALRRNPRFEAARTALDELRSG